MTGKDNFDRDMPHGSQGDADPERDIFDEADEAVARITPGHIEDGLCRVLRRAGYTSRPAVGVAAPDLGAMLAQDAAMDDKMLWVDHDGAWRQHLNLLARIRSASHQLEAVLEELASARNDVDKALSTVRAARHQADAITVAAQREAEFTIGQARTQADRIIGEARLRAVTSNPVAASQDSPYTMVMRDRESAVSARSRAATLRVPRVQESLKVFSADGEPLMIRVVVLHEGDLDFKPGDIWGMQPPLSLSSATALAGVPRGNSPASGREAMTSAASDTLTSREHEIAVLMASGLSNRKIAARLTISKRTVDAHVEHIFSKLGISSRVQLTAWLRATLASRDAGGGAARRPLPEKGASHSVAGDADMTDLAGRLEQMIVRYHLQADAAHDQDHAPLPTADWNIRLTRISSPSLYDRARSTTFYFTQDDEKETSTRNRW